MSRLLEGKTVLITGASRGIGRAIATRFALEGARLGLLATGGGRLEEVAAKCRELGAEVCPAACDITRAAEVEAAVARVRALLGPVQVLINNAGVGRYAPFMELTEGDWDAMLGVNVKGLVLVTRAVLPDMIAARSGIVVNMSSVQGLQTGPRASAYSATKYAVMAITEALGREMVEHNVRVAAVCPGGVLTDFAGIPAEKKNQAFLQPEDVAKVVLDTVCYPGSAWVKQVTVVPFV